MKVFDKSEVRDGWAPSRGELDEWLKGRVLCSLSTLDAEGAPESATVAFSVAEDGGYIIGTSKDSHKAANLDGDNRVAMVVTDPETRYTVQIKGTAVKLAQTAFDALADEHYRQRPESLPFRDEPDQVHIKVTPHLIRFSDCSVHPWLVTEYEA